MKEWEKRSEHSLSAEQRELYWRHQLLRFPSMRVEDQVGWLEQLRASLGVSFDSFVKRYESAKAAQEARDAEAVARQQAEAGFGIATFFGAAAPAPVSPSVLSPALLRLDDLLRSRFETKGGLAAISSHSAAAQEWLSASGLLDQHEHFDFVRQQSRADVSGLERHYLTALKDKQLSIDFGSCPSIADKLSGGTAEVSQQVECRDWNKTPASILQ